MIQPMLEGTTPSFIGGKVPEISPGVENGSATSSRNGTLAR